MNQKVSKLAAIALAVIFTVSLATNIQAQTVVSQQVKSPAWIHVPNNPDVPATDSNGNQVFIKSTITRADTAVSIEENVAGTPIANNEPWQSASWLTSVVFSKLLSLTTEISCIWDQVGTLVLPGDSNGPASDNAGTIILVNFVPMGSTTRLPLSEGIVQNIGGKLYLVETQKIPGLRSAFDQFGGFIPIDRYVDGEQWKTIPLWWAVPMGPATDPRYNVKGAVEITIIRNGAGNARWLVGYSVVMMNGCGTLPPPPPPVIVSTFKSPYDLLCTWDCLSSQGCSGSKPILIYFPYEDRVSNALDRPWLVRNYLQGHYGELWAQYVATQIQVEQSATPWKFNQAQLFDLTAQEFKQTVLLSSGLLITPANTLGELLWAIRINRNFLTEEDKTSLTQILSLVNRANKLGAPASRAVSQGRSGLTTRNSIQRSLQNEDDEASQTKNEN